MTELKNSIKQQMFDYFTKNHKELFQSDKSVGDVNSEILNAFYPELTEPQDKRAKLKVIGSYKSEYLKIYSQKPEPTSQVQELITDDRTTTTDDKTPEPPTTTDDKQQPPYDISSLLSIITDIQHKMTLQQNQITELQSKVNELNARTNNTPLITEIIKDDISNMDKTRYTLYITNTNVEYIKAFSKQNHNVSITALLNYLLNQFRTQNPLTDDNTEPPTEPQAKSLF